MKSIFVLFTLIILSYACDSSVSPNNSENSYGTIHKINVTTWMYGTHTINDNNGNLLYALTSTTVDLNTFENKQVKIYGNLIEGYPVDGGPEYLNVISITLLK